MKKILLSLIVILFSSEGLAEGDANSDLPQIHPECITIVAMGQGPVNLEECGQEYYATYTDTGASLQYEDEYGHLVYDIYKILHIEGNHLLVYYQWSGGGSGQFSGLMIVELNGTLLGEYEDISGGDRCSGLNSVYKENGKVYYRQGLLPDDLLAWGAIEKMTYEAELEYSAMSCVATANMVYDIATHTNQLISVDIDQTDGEDQEGWTENYAHQACFNRLIRERLATGKLTFDKNGLQEFTHRFSSQCLAGNDG